MIVAEPELFQYVNAAVQGGLPLPANQSYLNSYPALLAHVASLTVLTEAELIVVAHLVYGWMPTVLHLDVDALPEVLPYCQAARQGTLLPAQHIAQLARVVNGSVVGTSKLLHFLNPLVYPIWDSRVFRVLGRLPSGSALKGHHYQVNNPALYLDYVQVCQEVVDMTNFQPIYELVREQFRQLPAYHSLDVTPMRALEYILFTAGAR